MQEPPINSFGQKLAAGSSLLLIVFDLLFVFYIISHWLTLGTDVDVEGARQVRIDLQLFMTLDAFSLLVTPLLAWMSFGLHRWWTAHPAAMYRSGLIMCYVGLLCGCTGILMQLQAFTSAHFLIFWLGLTFSRCLSSKDSENDADDPFQIWFIAFTWLILIPPVVIIFASVSVMRFGFDHPSEIFWVITLFAFTFYSFIAYERLVSHVWLRKKMGPLSDMFDRLPESSENNENNESDENEQADKENDGGKGWDVNLSSIKHYFLKRKSQLVFMLIITLIPVVCFLFSADSVSTMKKIDFPHPIKNMTGDWFLAQEIVYGLCIGLMVLGFILMFSHLDKAHKDKG